MVHRLPAHRVGGQLSYQRERMLTRRTSRGVPDLAQRDDSRNALSTTKGSNEVVELVKVPQTKGNWNQGRRFRNK